MLDKATPTPTEYRQSFTTLESTFDMTALPLKLGLLPTLKDTSITRKNISSPTEPQSSLPATYF